MFMLYVRVLILFAGRLFTTDAQLVKRVAAQLGGDVTFDIDGAVNSQCQTHEGRMVVCLDGTTMEGIGPEFQNRISGSCDHIKLKDVRKEDLDHMFICENLDPLKPASYTYSIKESYIPVAAQLGGDVTFDIKDAIDSQCKTHIGKVVVCFHGTTMEGIGPEFQNRISGSCDNIKLKDVQKGDLDHKFICQNLDPLKPASYTYIIKAATAPPQNISLSINGSKVSVLWQPPPADWQTGPILEYEVKMSCNAPELLMDEITVAGTSTVLEGLPQGVWCTVTVAAVTSDGVEAWSKRKPVFIRLSGPSGITGTDLQPFDKTKLFWLLVVPLVVLLVLVLVLLRKRHMNGVSRPQPNAEQTENDYPLLDITPVSQ